MTRLTTTSYPPPAAPKNNWWYSTWSPQSDEGTVMPKNRRRSVEINRGPGQATHAHARMQGLAMGTSTLLLKQGGLGQRWLRSVRVQLPPSLKAFRAPFLVAIAYFLGAQAAFSIVTLSDQIFAPFWPPNIILFCTLVLVPKRQW